MRTAASVPVEVLDLGHMAEPVEEVDRQLALVEARGWGELGVPGGCTIPVIATGVTGRPTPRATKLRSSRTNSSARSSGIGAPKRSIKATSWRRFTCIPSGGGCWSVHERFHPVASQRSSVKAFPSVESPRMRSRDNGPAGKMISLGLRGPPVAARSAPAPRHLARRRRAGDAVLRLLGQPPEAAVLRRLEHRDPLSVSTRPACRWLPAGGAGSSHGKDGPCESRE
jgi:hypothetical protein